MEEKSSVPDEACQEVRRHDGVVERLAMEPVAAMPSCTPFLDCHEARLLPDYFQSRSEAMKEILADGWWPMAWIDKPGSAYADHWHIGAEALYMLEGELVFTDLEAGKTHQLQPGEKLVLPARVRHRVSAPAGATYLISLSVLVPFDDHCIPVEKTP